MNKQIVLDKLIMANQEALFNHGTPVSVERLDLEEAINALKTLIYIDLISEQVKTSIDMKYDQKTGRLKWEGLGIHE